MAIYVPDSTRRRRVIVIAAASLLAGLVAGGLFGRATSPGIDDAVGNVHAKASDAITALERLPIEYEQALAAEGGEDTGTITSALERASADLDAAYDEIDVFGPAVREGTDAAFETLAREVADAVPQGEFERGIDAAIAEIRGTFGLSADAATG